MDEEGRDEEAKKYFNLAYLTLQKDFEMLPNVRERVIRNLTKAIEIDPEYGEAWAELGRRLLLWGKYEEAIPFYKKTLEINPNSKRAPYLKSPLCDMGEALEKLGRYKEAIACYDKVAEIDPDDGEALRRQIAKGMRLSGYSGQIIIGGKEVKRNG